MGTLYEKTVLVLIILKWKLVIFETILALRFDYF